MTFVGLGVALILAMVFMMVGFHRIGDEGRVTMELIFGIAGLALFVIFVRGAWMITGGAATHVFSIDSDRIEWGFSGKEKALPVVDIAEIYWDDTDGFTLVVTKHDGKRVRFYFIENAVPPGRRGGLLKCIRTVLPAIPIRGNFHARTERDAG